jgi:hypothetical protein
MIEDYKGRPIENWNSFDIDIVSIYSWEGFFQVDNTFQELMISGNLTIIANETIKMAY